MFLLKSQMSGITHERTQSQAYTPVTYFFFFVSEMPVISTNYCLHVFLPLGGGKKLQRCNGPSHCRANDPQPLLWKCGHLEVCRGLLTWAVP